MGFGADFLSSLHPPSGADESQWGVRFMRLKSSDKVLEGEDCLRTLESLQFWNLEGSCCCLLQRVSQQLRSVLLHAAKWPLVGQRFS